MYHASMSKQKTEFVFALLAASGKIERRFDRVLSAVRGVSFTEYMLLKRLQEQPNSSASRVDLAALVHLTPSAVTRALKPLEKTGVVTSHKNERDARQTVARLTDAGKELVSDADAVLQDEITALPIAASDAKILTGSLAALSNWRFG